jgi:hypothetical protein
MNVIKSKNNPHKRFKYLESMFKLVNIFSKCFENKYSFSLINMLWEKNCISKFRYAKGFKLNILIMMCWQFFNITWKCYELIKDIICDSEGWILTYDIL